MPEVSDQQEVEQQPHHNHYYQDQKWRWLAEAPPLGLAIVLSVIMLGVFFASTGGSLSPGRSFNIIVPQILTAGFFVIPMAIMMASGEIDLSMGELAGMAGYIAAILSEQVNFSTGLLASLVAALLIGLINGLLVGLGKLKGVIVTFAMAFLLHGLLLLIGGGQTEVAPPALVELNLATSPLIILIWLGLIGGGVVLMKFTPFGAQPSPGESTDRPFITHLLYRGLPYVFSSLMAWVAGLLMLSWVRYATIAGGTGYVELALLAALLGGTAYAAGTGFVLSAAVATIPVVLLQTTFMAANTPSALLRTTQGLLLLIMLLLAHLYQKGVDWLYTRRSKADGDSTEEAQESPTDQEADIEEADIEDGATR